MPVEGEWARADVFPVLDDLCPKGSLNWPEIAKTYGFDPSVLNDPQGTVPITAWHGVFEIAAETLGNDAILFDFFNDLVIGRFSVFDYLFSCAPTMRDACKAWAKFIPIRTNAYRISFEETETDGSVEWPVLEGRGEWRQNMFARIGWATQQIEHALGMAAPPISIELATYSPSGPSKFLEKYKGRILFGARKNRIILPKTLLDQPLRQMDQNLYGIILKSAEQELAEIGQQESPLSRIANEIAAGLSEGGGSLPRIASELGMSQRAVQRILEKEGITFRKLNEEIRKSAAERYLQSTDLPMKEIAYLLGFSELSTFSRAVKIWFGASPRKVREKLTSDQIKLPTGAPDVLRKGDVAGHPLHGAVETTH